MSELTPKEQRAILDGDYPALVGMNRFEVGQVLEITSRVSVRIEKRNLRRNKVSWDYVVIDNRDRVLRFRPPARGKQVPAEELSATEIKRASEQSAYDGNPRDPMDAGVCVSPEVQEEYSRQGWDNLEVLKGEEKLKKAAKARAERLRQAELELRRKGKSPDHYLQAVEEAVKAMKDEARAA